MHDALPINKKLTGREGGGKGEMGVRRKKGSRKRWISFSWNVLLLQKAIKSQEELGLLL